MAMLNHQSISIADAERIAVAMAKINEVPFFLAQCGIGKSTISHALRKLAELNIHYVLDFNAQIRELSDIMGIPHTITKADGQTVTEWAVPQEFYKIVELAKEGKRSLILVDEVTNCNEVMQGSLQRLILDKVAGTLDLKVNGIEPVIIVCGNRPEDNTNYNEVPLALFDRVQPYEITASADDVIEYAVKQAWHPLIISYLRQFPQAINEGWLPDCYVSFTPRSAERLSKLEFSGIAKDLELPIIQSIMGSERATEYVAFRRVWADMIDRNTIYANPKTAPVPDQSRPDILYTMAQSLAYFMTKENASATVQYLDRLDKEFAIMCVADAVKRDKKLVTNADVKKFAMSNIAVFTDLM